MDVDIFPILNAIFAGFVIQICLYGLFICLAITTLFLLRSHSYNSITVKAGLVLIMGTTTATAAISIVDNYNGWVVYGDKEGGPAAWFLTDLNASLAAAKDLLLVLQSTIADILICWRLYMIWSKNWVILVIPAIIVLAGFSSSCAILAYEFLGVANPEVNYGFHIRDFTIFTFSSTMFLNTLVTVLISGKLWWMSRQLSRATGRNENSYWKIVQACVESGFLYTVTDLAFIICYSAKSYPGTFFMGYIVPLSNAISFTIILLRLNIGRRNNRGETTWSKNTTQTGLTASQQHRKGRDSRDMDVHYPVRSDFGASGHLKSPSRPGSHMPSARRPNVYAIDEDEDIEKSINELYGKVEITTPMPTLSHQHIGEPEPWPPNLFTSKVGSQFENPRLGDLELDAMASGPRSWTPRAL